VADYWRPLAIGEAGLPLAGGLLRFAAVERLRRGSPPKRCALEALPDVWRARLTAPRALALLPEGRPAVMGILNVTPDSFSEGGRALASPELAVAAVRAMVTAGADLIDVGAESTRPGAVAVPLEEELRRLGGVMPALAGLRWSIDTRKAQVMAAALDAGAAMVNDVSALGYDADAMPLVAARGCPVVLMHAQGPPETMQSAPAYEDVLLDVFDWLAARVAACEAAGIGRQRILVDVGIGFGKTVAHNLALLRGLALFHGLGVPLLLGASRKKTIGAVAGDAPVTERLGGSLALALHGAARGVQVVRVHDVPETVQALRLWQAASSGVFET
jgi:dihydropteroate synthase